MNKQAVINILNKAVSLEYAGGIMYLQHSVLVQGVDREVHSKFFKEMSDCCFDHARKIGSFIVALEGVPTVEPETIRQSTDLNEMLRLGLEVEETALQTYKDAISIAADEVPLRVMLEHMAHDEYLHMVEVEKMLSKKALQIPLSAKEVKFKRVG